MATTISNQIRIGAANVFIDTYGSAFSPGTDLGKTHEDGITFNYETQNLELSSAQDVTVLDIFEIGPQRLTIEFALREHMSRNHALSFGQTLSDTTDNTGDTPPNTSIFIGGYKTPTYYAMRLKVPQVITTTLYDIILLYRAKFVAAFNQAFTHRGERYIPISAICAADSNNSGRYGKISIEGVAA